MTEPASRLFRADPKAYTPDYQRHLFEQYKLYVNSADRISSRRDKANNFFLAINTGLLAVFGISPSTSLLDGGSQEDVALVDSHTASLVILVAAAGLLLCATWYQLVHSYRKLNSAKFEVIHEIEDQLPLAVYDAEWAIIRRGKDPKRYRPFTHLESYVPATFAAVYLIAALIGAVSVLQG